MEEALNTNVETVAGNMQPEAAGGDNVVYLADMDIGADNGSMVEQETRTDEPAAPETHADGAQQPEEATNQNVGTAKDFSAALNKRVAEIQAREQAKYESSDEYQFGRRMLQERAARESISVQEARKRYEEEQISSLANEYQSNPKKFIEDFLRSKNATPPVQQAQPQQLQPEANVIARQVVEAKKNGLLPESFSPADLTAEFISNVRQYGIEGAAERMIPAGAQAPQGFATAESIANELERRRSAPRPMRPVSQGASMGTVNFERMTEDQFKKYEASIDKAIMEGKRVR